MRDEKGTVQTKLAMFLLSYRNTPHCTTNETPARLQMRRNLRTRLDLVKPNARRTVENQQTKQSSGHSLTRQFMVGQPVAVREYKKDQKWVPGVISSRNGPLSYQVEVSGNATWKRHVDQIRDSRISPAMEAIPDNFTIPFSTPPADGEMKTKAIDPANRLKSDIHNSRS